MLYPLVLLVCLVGTPPPCPSAATFGDAGISTASVMPVPDAHPGDLPRRRAPMHRRGV